MGIFGIAKRGFGLLGKKGKTISSVKPSVSETGTRNLIDTYKKHVSKTKVPTEKKVGALKEIHKFSKKHGLTKGDVNIGAALEKKK